MGEEERIWDIDASVREKFNAKSLYELALREDIPWRQWNHWVREKIVTYLRENNRIANNFNGQQQQPQMGGYGGQPTHGHHPSQQSFHQLPQQGGYAQPQQNNMYAQPQQGGYGGAQQQFVPPAQPVNLPA